MLLIYKLLSGFQEIERTLLDLNCTESWYTYKLYMLYSVTL